MTQTYWQYIETKVRAALAEATKAPNHQAWLDAMANVPYGALGAAIEEIDRLRKALDNRDQVIGAMDRGLAAHHRPRRSGPGVHRGGGVREERREVMRIDVTKDWCLRMAELEADEEIGAGLLAVEFCDIDIGFTTVQRGDKAVTSVHPMDESHPMIYVETAVGRGYGARHIKPIYKLQIEAPHAITGEPMPIGWASVIAAMTMKIAAGEDFSVSIAPTLTGNVVVTWHTPAPVRPAFEWRSNWKPGVSAAWDLVVGGEFKARVTDRYGRGTLTYLDGQTRVHTEYDTSDQAKRAAELRFGVGPAVD